LVGRAVELDLITAFLGAAVLRGGALLFTGELGVGKSALLDIAAETARESGCRAVPSNGVESETRVAFAGLHQIVGELRAPLDELSARHRGVLDVALGLAPGPRADQLVVCNATLELLRVAARDAPLVLIVDDIQWVDSESSAVLGFVARRLGGLQVGFLAAAQTVSAGLFDSVGLAEH
jgi:predicted ATP-dependent serine protease